MKKFGTSNLPFRVGAGGNDIPDNDDQELENTTDQFSNNMYSELKTLIESSGQTLTNLTGEDINQVAKAAFLFSGKSSYFTADSSTANNKILTSYNTGFSIPDFDLFDGFEFKFINKVANTGNVTFFIDGSNQTQALPLLDLDGNQLPAGILIDGGYYSVRYIAAINAFTLFESKQYAATKHTHVASDVTNFNAAVAALFTTNNQSTYTVMDFPNGLKMQWIKFTSYQSAAGGSRVTFPVEFPNLCLSVATTDVASVSSGIEIVQSFDLDRLGFTVFNTVILSGGTFVQTPFSFGILAYGY